MYDLNEICNRLYLEMNKYSSRIKFNNKELQIELLINTRLRFFLKKTSSKNKIITIECTI